MDSLSLVPLFFNFHFFGIIDILFPVSFRLNSPIGRDKGLKIPPV